MGFTTGFTGGVALTLSVAYLAVRTHQRNREAQGAQLRALAQELRARDPYYEPPRPTNAAGQPLSRVEQAALQRRASLLESAKDRWNAEVEGAVRWAQSQDLNALREGAESLAATLWSRAAQSGEAQAAGQEVRQAAGSVAAEARRDADAGRAAAQGVLEQTRAAGARAAGAAQVKAEEAKTAAKGIIAQGVDKGREIVQKAKTAVGIAEQKAEAVVVGGALQESPVDKALRQRYEKKTVLSETVDDVFRDRYTPIEQRDNTKLRGL